MAALFIISLLVSWLSAAAAPGASDPAPTPLVAASESRNTDEADGVIPLRPLRPWIRGLIWEARLRSATLDRLIRAAESSHAVIYIDETDTRDYWNGRALFAALAGGHSYLRIELQRLDPNITAGILAHELQRAIEIASAGVSTQAEVVSLYQRIGVELKAGIRDRRFESTAAIEAGEKTLLELRRRGARARVGTPSD